MDIDLLPIFEKSYKVIKELGRGAFSIVYLVSKDNKLYAAKIPLHESERDIETMTGRIVPEIDVYINDVISQAKVLFKLSDNTKYFPMYYGLYKSYRRIFASHRWLPVVIMEFIDGRPVSHFLKRHIEFDMIQVLRDIVKAESILISKGMIHGDIHEDNVIVTKSGTVLIDITGDVINLDEGYLHEEVGVDKEYYDELVANYTMFELNVVRDIKTIGQLALLMFQQCGDRRTCDKLAKVGTRCTVDNPEERPKSMADILVILS